MSESPHLPPPPSPDAASLPRAPAPSARAVRRLYVVGAAVLIGAGLTTAVLQAHRGAEVAAARLQLAAAADAGISVLAAPVGRAPSTRHLSLPGELRPWQSAVLYAKVAGYLERIDVDKGDRVRRGQPLAHVLSPETDQQVLSLAAELHNKQQLEARYRALAPSGAISQQELEDVVAARASAQAALDGAHALKRYEVIRAPYDGVVTARFTDAGALLPAATSSTQAAQPLLEIQDMAQVRVFVYVGQADAPFVRVGDAAHITCHDLPDLALDAKVARVAGALEAHTRTMLVELDIDNRSGVLTPGLFVQVGLDIAVPSALTVPVDAIFLRAGVPHVAVVHEGVAHYRQVKTGLDDGRNVHILEGVEAGEHVGLHIADDVSDGARVRIIEPHHSHVPKAD